jgi:hypothetical protein
MFPEANPKGHAPAWHAEGVLRRPDGSPDIAAYAMLAHHERTAAIAASARGAIRMVREMVSGIRASLAPAARSEPTCGKHQAAARR